MCSESHHPWSEMVMQTQVPGVEPVPPKTECYHPWQELVIDHPGVELGVGPVT